MLAMAVLISFDLITVFLLLWILFEDLRRALVAWMLFLLIVVIPISQITEWENDAAQCDACSEPMSTRDYVIFCCGYYIECRLRWHSRSMDYCAAHTQFGLCYKHGERDPDDALPELPAEIASGEQCLKAIDDVYANFSWHTNYWM